MAKINSYLGNQCLTSIYYSLDYPYLIYGCLLWGNNYDNPLSQLILLQNKAVRIIYDVPLQDHITPHYVPLGLLKFRDIVKIYNCFYMIMSLIISHVIFHYFLYLSNIVILHEVHLLSSYLHIPHSRINIRKFCPAVIGKYYWNDLPLSIRNKSSKILFKKALKKYYLAQY